MVVKRWQLVPIQMLAIYLLTGCLWTTGGILTSAVDGQSPAPEKKDKADEPTIRALIKQLGDEEFEKREVAAKRLADIGEPALQLLDRAAKQDSDMEVRFRAQALVRAIGTLFLRELRRYEGHADEPHRKATRVVVTPDGRYAVSSGSAMLRYWDIETGKQLLVFGPTSRASYWALAISKDGKRVLAGGEDNLAQVFELPSGKLVRQLAGHTGSVRGAVLLADGKRAVTGAWDQSVRLWDVETGKELLRFENANEDVRGLAISPDGKMLAGAICRIPDGSPGTVRLWDIDTGKTIRAMVGHTENASSVAFSPDGKTLVSCGFDGTLRLWDVAKGNELKQLKATAHRMEFVSFTPDGRRILACGGTINPTLRLWDVTSGKLVVESEDVGGGILCVAALPDNQRCLTATRDGLLRLWEWKR